MGRRTISGFISSGINSEYYKTIPDLEARIRTVFEDSTELINGTANGSLANGQFYFNNAQKRLYVKTTDASSPVDNVIQIFTYFQAWGAWATQAEINNNELFQVFTANTDYYIRYIRLFVVKKNNPLFTGLKLEIHPVVDNYPASKVLATSTNEWTNSSINSFDNSASEIWFKFNDFAIKNGSDYAIVFKATGTFTADTHLAWMKMKPVYSDTLPNNMNQVGRGSFRYVIIGREP